MNNPRLMFAMATVVLAFLLYDRWVAAHQPVPPPATVQSSATATAPTSPNSNSSAELPPTPTASANPVATDLPNAQVSATPITSEAVANYKVETDLFSLEISPQGANIVEASLKQYSLSLQRPKDLVRLLAQKANPDTGAIMLRAQSGLLSANAQLPNHQSLFTVPATPAVLADGQNTLEVPFTWTDASGITVKKTYTFSRGSYAVQVRDEITNASANAIAASSYKQFIQYDPPGLTASFFSKPEQFSFVGTAIFSAEQQFEKFPLKRYREEPLNRNIAGGWLASLRHHFLVSWIPVAGETNQYQTVLLPADGVEAERMLARLQSAPLNIAPNTSGKFSATLYVGPKLPDSLEAVAPGLGKTVDYGRVTIFAEPLHWLLIKLHGLVKNWGLAIILLVLLIKVVFYKLSEKQFTSAAKMKAIAPKIEEIKRRYPDDRQKQAQAQMELFQKEKVNPMAGCLPILITIPVFLGLYWVLVEAVELRQAPFLFWIKDLTAADPYFVLPVLNALVMFITSKMTPMTGVDPIQQKMFTYMPLIFGVMMAFFPAGLVLYWTVNGLLTLAQQRYVYNKIEAQTATKKAN